MINPNKIPLLVQHLDSYWIDCLVYSRSFALPPSVFTASVLETPAIQQGIQQLVAGNPAAALQLLRAIITDPDRLPQREAASILFAAALLLARNHEESAQIFSAFCRDYPSDCHFPYYLALCQLKLGQPQAAISNLERSLELQPGFIQAWGAIGLLAGLVRDHEIALEACSKALAANYEIGNQLLSLCQFQARLELGLLPFSNQHFDSRLFEAVGETEHQALLQRLPALHSGYASAPFNPELPLLFCAADSNYFHDHIVPLWLSLTSTKSECNLHIHVFNPDADVERRARSLATLSGAYPMRLSFEQGEIAAIAPPLLYYSCIRFCRFFQATAEHPGPCLMVDADALFRQPLQILLSTLADQPKPVVTHLPLEPIWQEVAAAFLLLDGAAASRSFLAHTSGVILQHLLHGQGRWFLDQMALYVARAQLEQSSHQTSGRVDSSLVYDINHSDSSFIWQVTNDKNAQRFVEYRQLLLDGFKANLPDDATRSSGEYPRGKQQSSQGSQSSAPGELQAAPTTSELDHQLVEALRAYLNTTQSEGQTQIAILTTIHFHLALLLAHHAQFKLHAVAEGCVLSGPFKGMRMPLPEVASDLGKLLPIDGGSANIAAFLLGTYEGELHAPLETLLADRTYDVILDLGCSIGYYAVGLALRQPAAVVHARDTNASSLDYVKAMAALNGVSKRVLTGGIWQSVDFETIANQRCLVFCDIEGAEKDLLNPASAPSLVGCDLIVELHDVFDSSISRTILDRFSPTHEITFVPNGSKRAPVPPEINVLNMHEAAIVLTELRTGATPWAVMRAHRHLM